METKMKLSAILLTVALFVSASVANAATTPSQQAGQQPGKPASTQQAAAEDAMPAGDAATAPAKLAPAPKAAAKDAKDAKEEAPKGNQMAPESK
jgi:hypothetical protein